MEESSQKGTAGKCLERDQPDGGRDAHDKERDAGLRDMPAGGRGGAIEGRQPVQYFQRHPSGSRSEEQPPGEASAIHYIPS